MRELIRAIGTTLLSWGPWGALVLATLDSAGIPIMEGVDALLVLMAAYDARAGYLGAGLAVIGSTIGSLLLFYIGRKGGEEFLDKRTQSRSAKRFRRWFHHYGGLTIFIPVLIPVPLPVKIFVLSAGALGMNRSHFVLLVMAARIPRYFGLAYLGSRMGTEPLKFLKENTPALLGVAFGLFVVLYIAVKIKDRMRLRAGLVQPESE